MDIQVRNDLVMQYHSFVWQTIMRNRPLLLALNIETDDAYQELMLVVIDAIGKFDPMRCDCMDKYINVKLQHGVLDMKAKYKPHGIIGTADRRLACVMADGAESEYFVSSSENYLAELADAFKLLTISERNAVNRSYAGFPLRTKEGKALLASGRTKLRLYYRNESVKPLLSAA